MVKEIREKATDILGKHFHDYVAYATMVPVTRDLYSKAVDEILSIETETHRIAVVRKEPVLPKRRAPTRRQIKIAHQTQWFDEEWYYAGQGKAQQDMLKTFVQEEPL